LLVKAERLFLSKQFLQEDSCKITVPCSLFFSQLESIILKSVDSLSTWDQFTCLLAKWKKEGYLAEFFHKDKFIPIWNWSFVLSYSPFSFLCINTYIPLWNNCESGWSLLPGREVVYMNVLMCQMFSAFCWSKMFFIWILFISIISQLFIHSFFLSEIQKWYRATDLVEGDLV
jgi:hypothetical protein